MSENIFEARLGILDTVRGVLLDLADFDSMDEGEKQEFGDQMGDVAEMLLEVLGLEVTSYNEETGEVVAKLLLSFED